MLLRAHWRAMGLQSRHSEGPWRPELVGLKQDLFPSYDKIEQNAAGTIRQITGRSGLPAMRDDLRRSVAMVYEACGLAGLIQMRERAVLADYAEMLLFSQNCGVPATSVWPLFLEANALFEAWAFWHNVTNRGRFGNPEITPSIVEAYFHRSAIEASGETDLMSEEWRDLLEHFEAAGLTRAVMMEHLVDLDRRHVLEGTSRY